MPSSEEIAVSPFLRWTGSKRWFVKDHLNDFLPSTFNNYHEPFLGGGAVFFHLRSINNEKRKFFLADYNEELINCYRQLRDNPREVVRKLALLVNSENDYYKIRSQSPVSQTSRAARFIYLNRTSFNGIYRVNSFGRYNVPYGRRTQVDVVTKDLLMKVSTMLAKTELANTSFERTLANIRKGDLVFIDPPYTVAHENNGFIEYNQKLFSWNDQMKLKNYILQIQRKKAFFILTNASHDSILQLYNEVGDLKILSRESIVGGRNKTRGNFNEMVFYNTK